jgi:hypothetical protein
MNDFKDFYSARVRSLRDGFADCVQQKATLKEITKSYQRWAILNDRAKKVAKDLEPLCEEMFGNSRGTKEYMHLRVFLDEEDVEDYDKENHSST